MRCLKPLIRPHISRRATLLAKRPATSLSHDNLCTTIASTLVPELRLHLLTPNMAIYKERDIVNSKDNDEPYWAIFWPGGQALARFVLDNPGHVANKRVLDLGCGSGACGLASILRGASHVTFNDVSIDALEAVKANLKENNLDTMESKFSLIGDDLTNNRSDIFSYVDVILLGDLFFDEDLSNRLMRILANFKTTNNQVLIGDPGRWTLIDEQQRTELGNQFGTKFCSWAKYELPEEVRREHVGLTQSFVFGLDTP